MTDLSSALLGFETISLKEMDHVKLLDRIDTKFVMHQHELTGILQLLVSEYKILTIENKSLQHYETLYFDTPGHNLYYMHHNGKRNRFKLRCRKYVDSGISFFEIKAKTNTSRTIKKRIQIDDIPQALPESLNQFIKENTSGKLQDFIPSLLVFFDRITLVNKIGSERLTIDIHIRYKFEGVEKVVGNLVIVEVKQDKNTISPFRKIMKHTRQRRNYLSKYCLGITCLNESIKKNRFKEKLTALNKLGYDV